MFIPTSTIQFAFPIFLPTLGSDSQLRSIRSFIVTALKKFSDLRKSELAVVGSGSQVPSQNVGSL
jgi:hypothetical protein